MIRGPQLSDQGMQAYKPPPKPIKAAPVKITYDKPQVATYSQNNGWSNPVGTYYPTTQAYPTTIWNGPANAAATTPVNDIPAAPVSAPVTPKAEPIDYSTYDNNKLAQVDSTFMDQKSMYAQLLKKYLEDYTRQGQNIDKDADLSREGIQKNKTNGLTSLNEDFAARGLGYSGIQAKEHGNATNAYAKQTSNVELNQKRSHDDLDFRKNKFVGENGENGSNIQAARREALNRLAAKQTLV